MWAYVTIWIFHSQIAQFLVDSGAHIDQLDRANKSPLGQLLATPYTGFLPLSHISLKCLSAKAIGTSGIPYSPKELPRELAEFLKLHLPMPPVGDHDESLLRIFRPNIIGWCSINCPEENPPLTETLYYGKLKFTRQLHVPCDWSPCNLMYCWLW